MLVAKSAQSPVARLSATPASSAGAASSKASAHTSAADAWANHGSSVGWGTVLGPAANGAPGERHADVGRLVGGDGAQRGRGEHLARRVRVVRAAAHGLQAREERGRRVRPQHPRHHREGLQALRRLLVVVAQERGGPVDDGDGVLQALGATERVREHERRPERHLGIVAGDGQRLLQVDLARGLTRGGLGHPELEQEPGTLGGGRRLGQRATQEDGRGLGCPAPRRGARGVHEAPCDRAIAGRLGGQQMLGRVLLARRLAVHQLSRAAVRQRALGDCEFLVDARAHERMDEGQRPVGLEDPRRHQRVRRFGRLGEVELGQGGRARQLGALEHRHRAGEARRGRGQATQAQLDPAARRARADRLDARRRSRIGAHPLRADGLDQLADEER